MRYLAIVFLLTSGCYFTPCDNPSCKRSVARRQLRPALSFQNLFLARQIALNKKFSVTDAGGVFPENSDDGLEQMGAALRLLKIKTVEDDSKRREERRRLFARRPESTYEKMKRQMEQEYVAGQNRKRYAAERKRYDAERRRYVRPSRNVRHEGSVDPEPLDAQEQEYFDEDVQETW